MENAKTQYGHQEILSLSDSCEVGSDLSWQNYVFHIWEEARLSSPGRHAVGQFRHCPRKRRAENSFGGFRDYRKLIYTTRVPKWYSECKLFRTTLSLGQCQLTTCLCDPLFHIGCGLLCLEICDTVPLGLCSNKVKKQACERRKTILKCFFISCGLNSPSLLTYKSRLFLYHQDHEFSITEIVNKASSAKLSNLQLTKFKLNLSAVL